MTTKPLRGLVAISIEDLHPSPNNPRRRLLDIDELAQSISEIGLIQPIVVQRIPGHDGYRIVAGHRRLLACKKLRMREVPCVLKRDMLPDEELLTMLVENGQRSGLDPIEEAHAVRTLVDGGHPLPDVARKVGRSTHWVQERLMLLKLSPEEQERVRAGHYTLSHATALVRAERALERQRLSPVARPVGRPKGATTKPYFGDTHPLAETARALCDHRGTPKVAGVACGSCWELVLRSDERDRIEGRVEAVGA